MAFIDKELCDINLRILNDSLVDVNKWLDVNMSQILDKDDDKAEKKASEMLEKASTIGKNTFMGGMTFFIAMFLLNFGNSWRRAKVMKQLEDESEKLASETRKLERESKMRQQESLKLAEESMKLSIEVEKNRRMVDGRSKMMYSIVHDLRTPLSIIIGYNDMEAKTPTKNEKYIKTIEFSAKQLRSMIDQLLDYFRLESNKEGTNFQVSLPMAVAEVRDEPLNTEVVKASDKKKRVLVVDDSNVWLLMTQEILERNGFECDVCDDTDKFFTMLRGGNYSLVMLDLQMPGKSGRELLDLMRKSKVANSQTVPVVVSTSSGEEMREELLNAGFTEFIPKTADVDAMVNVINDVIDKSTRTVTPDFSRLRKSVAGFLIDETEDAVDGLHDAMDNMDFDEMNKLAHSLKSSWVPYRIGVLIDPVMEIAKQRNMGASNRLATYMAEIDKMAEIVIAKCKEIQGSEE